MKKTLLILLFAISIGSQAQHIRFNNQLNEYCENSVKSFSSIDAERKKMLDKIAAELVTKKNILFSCQTNTRRTQLLQTWMQTSFYYYGILNRVTYSYGDTVSEVYPEIIKVLKNTGFTYYEANSKPNVYGFYINDKYPLNPIYPKKMPSKVDKNKSVYVNICASGESSISLKEKSFDLPFESPKLFDNTQQEEQKYIELNNRIALEMLYLASKTRELIYKAEEE